MSSLSPENFMFKSETDQILENRKERSISLFNVLNYFLK